jgi:hypothetical protein
MIKKDVATHPFLSFNNLALLLSCIKFASVRKVYKRDKP